MVPIRKRAGQDLFGLLLAATVAAVACGDPAPATPAGDTAGDSAGEFDVDVQTTADAETDVSLLETEVKDADVGDDADAGAEVAIDADAIDTAEITQDSSDATEIGPDADADVQPDETVGEDAEVATDVPDAAPDGQTDDAATDADGPDVPDASADQEVSELVDAAVEVTEGTDASVEIDDSDVATDAAGTDAEAQEVTAGCVTIADCATPSDLCLVPVCNPDGSCGTAAKTCADDNFCTDDSCDSATGCVFADNSKACEDGNACTLGDVCTLGLCVGITTTCDDANVCTDDNCLPLTGCLNPPNAATCTDSDACSVGEACSSGLCQGALFANCNDNNVCTDDACSPASGCTNLANAATCTDGDACTTGDHCAESSCLTTGVKPCDDGKLCTDNTCDVDLGCVFPANSLACSDGNKCTLGDHCVDGGCKTTGAFDCDDKTACTTDGCDKNAGCFHLPVSGLCEDGDPCTSGEYCQGGVCVGGSSIDCNDDVDCTIDSCDGLGGCSNLASNALCDDGKICTDNVCQSMVGCKFLFNSLSCDDGNACTLNDSCGGGLCQPGIAKNCDDNNACTADSCSGGACVNSATNEGSGCEDGDLCTVSEKCAGGKCGGKALSCDDGVSCTADSCVSASGCQHATNATLCDDGNPCTVDACGLSGCTHGLASGCAAQPCDSSHACAVGICDLTLRACVACINHVDCGSGSVCEAHVCIPAPVCASDLNCKATSQVCNTSVGVCVDCNVPTDCMPGQACVENSCVPAAACTTSKQCPKVCNTGANVCVDCNSSADCPTNSYCDTAHRCVADLCTVLGCNGLGSFACNGDGGGYATVLSCDDANTCTTDSCASSTGCAHAANTLTCDDGNGCTVGDVCAANNCVSGGPKNCDDANVCTGDSCTAPGGVCTHSNLTTGCDDGNVCTQGDTCAGGSCTSTQSWTVATLAGTGVAAFVDGAGASAQFKHLYGLAVGAAGDVYVADATRIRHIAPDGTTTTLTGGATAGDVDGPAGTATLNLPFGLGLDTSGNIWFSEFNGNRIRMATPAGTVTTMGGAGVSGFSDGPSSQAKLNGPCGIVVGKDGTVWFADRYNHRIRTLTTDGYITTIAGSGTAGSVDGPALSATFNEPVFVARDVIGNLYVSEAIGNRIRVLSVSGTVWTLAGGSQGFKDGSGTAAQFYGPHQLAFRGDGTLLVTDHGNNRVRAVTLGGVVTTLAGTGSAGIGNGLAASATFNAPIGLGVDKTGNIVVSDESGFTMRKIWQSAILCSDNDLCTADSCDTKLGCAVTATTACDDGSACTNNDTCTASACVGTAVSCDDGNPCTNDSCTPSTGCAHPATALGATCGNGLTCDGVGDCSCGNGVCEFGESCCVADCGKCGPPWTYDGTNDLSHQYGDYSSYYGGWECQYGTCQTGYMDYGPYTKQVPAGSHTAHFYMTGTSNCFGCTLVHLDVNDSNHGVLASVDVPRGNIAKPTSGNWSDFQLNFTSYPDSILEFRVKFPGTPNNFQVAVLQKVVVW